MMASARLWVMVGVIAFSGLGAITTARADAIKFNTLGLIDSTYNVPKLFDQGPRTVAGADAISFRGVSEGSLTPGQSARLGEFVIEPVAGLASTYNNTPFTVQVTTPDLDYFEPNGFHEGGLTIRGHINGTISATGAQDLTVSFDSVEKGYAKLALVQVDYFKDFPLPTSAVVLPHSSRFVSDSTVGAVTTALDVQITPEPGTIALFLGAGAAVLVRKRLRAGRKIAA